MHGCGDYMVAVKTALRACGLHPKHICEKSGFSPYFKMLRKSAEKCLLKLKCVNMSFLEFLRNVGLDILAMFLDTRSLVSQVDFCILFPFMTVKREEIF